MTAYANVENGGILGYEILKDGILIQFKDGTSYLYDTVKPGKVHVKKMKELAVTGSGLTTYINQYIRGNYREKKQL